LGNILTPVKLWLDSNKGFLFPFLAFAIPLLVRAIPEFLMAPYLVGFDTLAHYVPTSLSWLRGDVDFWRYIATAPLFYTIVVSLVSLGGPLITVLKVIPPVFHGFLGLSIYACAKSGLGWSPSKSMAVSLLATVYFVALRVSWDSLRNELALIFFFVALALLSAGQRNSYSWKRYVLLSMTMLAVVLAHQLVSVIMLSVVLVTIAYGISLKEYRNAGYLFLLSLPAALLFFAIFYFSPVVPEFRLIFGFSTNDGWLSLFGYSSYPAMLVSVFGFFFFCYLPLLPLVLLSFKRFGNSQLKTWVVLSLILLFVPVVSPSNLRWVLMLTYPLAFLVVDALSRIQSSSWNRLGLSIHKIAVVYLVLMLSVLSLGFMLMPPETPLPYLSSGVYNSYIYQMPSSMLQNTVSIVDCQGVADALQWLKNNMDGNARLLTHRAFYGWALLTLSESQVVLYEYENPANTAKTVFQEGYNQIYLIWWTSGEGWYGQSIVPSSFDVVYQSDKIAIYSYKPTDAA
jgi:hypothetical protein